MDDGVLGEGEVDGEERAGSGAFIEESAVDESGISAAPSRPREESVPVTTSREKEENDSHLQVRLPLVDGCCFCGRLEPVQGRRHTADLASGRI